MTEYEQGYEHGHADATRQAIEFEAIETATAYAAVKAWAGIENLVGDGPGLDGYNSARLHVREMLRSMHANHPQWVLGFEAGRKSERKHQDMTRTNLHLPDNARDALKALSEATGLPVAEHVRRAIDAYLKIWHEEVDTISKTAIVQQLFDAQKR